MGLILDLPRAWVQKAIRKEVDMENKGICDHVNWRPAGYKQAHHVYRVCSMYEVYCLDCGDFINLITGEMINDKGLEQVRFLNG